MDAHIAINSWLTSRDQRAARWLVESHRGMVAAVARQRMPHYALVEEVVQDVFIQIFAALSKFDQARPFVPWLIGVTRRRCNLRLRCWKRTRMFAACENPLDAITEEHIPTTAAMDAAPEAMVRAERCSAMAKLIDRLAPRDREMMLLQHEHDLSADEAAKRLGITINNMRVRTFRIRQTLRRRLSELSD